MEQQICLFCGNKIELVHVHGHYQCPICHTNAMPCCDGDNCNTNNLLKEQETDNAATISGRTAVLHS